MVEILPFLQSTIAVGALAAGVALDIETAHGNGMLADFLMKKVKAECVLMTPDASDVLVIGMARGDATIAEIKVALEQTQLERDMSDQANARKVLHETLRVLSEPSGGFTDPVQIEVSLGGGKGIPFEKGDGWKWFVYNLGANDQVAGAFLHIYGTYYGVWL